jgi:hypothetical protein
MNTLPLCFIEVSVLGGSNSALERAGGAGGKVRG